MQTEEKNPPFDWRARFRQLVRELIDAAKDPETGKTSFRNFAKEKGYSYNSWNGWATGRKTVKLVTLIDICDRLDISPTWLLLNKGPRLLPLADRLGWVEQELLEDPTLTVDDILPRLKADLERGLHQARQISAASDRKRIFDLKKGVQSTAKPQTVPSNPNETTTNTFKKQSDSSSSRASVRKVKQASQKKPAGSDRT
jgi:hypothetical protein